MKSSSLMIGHTRWATHGKPNIKNCHPHIIDNLSLVHNGVVENYEEIKNSKIFKNVQFKSETDTEMILRLIQIFYKSNTLVDAIKKTSKLIKGSNAFVCSNIDKGNDELLHVKIILPYIMGLKKMEKRFSHRM